MKQTITGLGGIGKTQIATEYAHRHMSEYKDAIWWINAEKSPKEDLFEFAERFKIFPEGMETTRKMSDEQFIKRLNIWFENHGSFLFIFDNMEAAEDIERYIPRTGHVLITTRERNLELRNTETIELDVFDDKEAIEFLHKRVPGIEDSDAKKLTKILGNLPLALEHAAAHMIKTRRSCAQYIKLLENSGLDVLDKPVKNINYKKTVTTTWQISIDQIKSESAIQLFNLCVYFAPDKIPLSILIEGRDKLPQPLREKLVPDNELAQDDLLLELSRYSLLSFQRDDQGNVLLSIHRLVQDVVRRKLEGDTQWISCCLDIARSVFKYEYGNIQSMDAFKHNVQHALEIARHAEKMLADDKEAQEKMGWLYVEAGLGFDYSGQYNEALTWFKKAMAIAEKVLGKDHPGTATTYNNIAGVFMDQGEYDKALEWYQKALDIREKVLGKDHPSTATTYDNIGLVYANKGDNSKALEWYQKALEIREKVLGKDHPSTATTYNNIGLVYDNQGDYAKALEWYQKALGIREKVFGYNHPHTKRVKERIDSCLAKK